MKTSISKFIAFTCITLVTSVGFLRAGDESRQPRMLKAVHLLQDAKKSAHPLPLLHDAKKALKDAEHNKGGFRRDAIHLVDQAITEAKTHDKDKMTQKINAAIAAIHAGAFKAH